MLYCVQKHLLVMSHLQYYLVMILFTIQKIHAYNQLIDCYNEHPGIILGAQFVPE